MAQRKTYEERESELQPVYDLLYALEPRRLYGGWKRLPRQARYLIVMLLAAIILMWSMLTIMQAIARHVEVTTRPVLYEALKAPYDLAARQLPVLSGDLEAGDAPPILPATAGRFVQVVEETQVLTPALLEILAEEQAEAEKEAAQNPPATPEPAAAEMAAEATLSVDSTAEAILSADETAEATVEVLPTATPEPMPTGPVYALATCLSETVTLDATTACVTFQAQYAALSTYQSPQGTTLRVMAVLFESDTEANQVMRALKDFAYTKGKVGNFVLGNQHPINYFYSYDPEVYAFTWSHDAWVYLVTGVHFQDVEDLTKAFPY